MPINMARIDTPEYLLRATQAVALRAELAFQDKANSVCQQTYQGFVMEGRQLVIKAEKWLGEPTSRFFRLAFLHDHVVCNSRMSWRFHLQTCLDALKALAHVIEKTLDNKADGTKPIHVCRLAGSTLRVFS
jgi:hypothetical protein